MSMKKVLDETTNSNVYNKARKMYLDQTGQIDCSRCPYHKYENYKADSWRKNWKEFRKTQWK